MAQLPISTFLSSGISIPVTEDTVRPLGTGVRAIANVGTPFSCTFGDVLDRHERHWNIFGQPSNPLAIVRRAIDDLKNAFFTYWKASHPDGWYDEKDRHGADGIYFSSEDARSSGSYFAEALAAYFLEERMKIAPGRIFFYSGTEARPDLMVKPKKNSQIAVALSGRPLLGIEARSRKGADMKYNLHADEVKRLDNKLRKSPAAKIIGIYSMYGLNTPTEKLTRIHLADPWDDGPPVSETLVEESALTHYWGVCSRLGLWFHRRMLAERLAELNPAWSTLVDQDAETNAIGFLPHRTIPSVSEPGNDIVYRGREFSTSIEAYQGNELSFQAASEAVAKGDYGEVYFRGLRDDVLMMITERRYVELGDFRDANVGRPDIDGRVSADGILTQTARGRDADIVTFFEQEAAKEPSQRLGRRRT